MTATKKDTKITVTTAFTILKEMANATCSKAFCTVDVTSAKHRNMADGLITCLNKLIEVSLPKNLMEEPSKEANTKRRSRTVAALQFNKNTLFLLEHEIYNLCKEASTSTKHLSWVYKSAQSSKVLDLLEKLYAKSQTYKSLLQSYGNKKHSRIEKNPEFNNRITLLNEVFSKKQDMKIQKSAAPAKRTAPKVAVGPKPISLLAKESTLEKLLELNIIEVKCEFEKNCLVKASKVVMSTTYKPTRFTVTSRTASSEELTALGMSSQDLEEKKKVYMEKLEELAKPVPSLTKFTLDLNKLISVEVEEARQRKIDDKLSQEVKNIERKLENLSASQKKRLLALLESGEKAAVKKSTRGQQ